jgi:acyl-CoA synthetase (AMP-forming)/AMP-acid ligase II
MRSLGLIETINAVFALAPEKGAIEYGGEWSSWGEIAAIRARVDKLLSRAGLGKGAPVGMLLRNRPAHFAALLGVLLSGRCIVTLNPFQSPQQIAKELATLRLPALVADVEDWQKDEIASTAADVGGVGLALTPGEVSAVPGLEAVDFGPHHANLPGVCILMLSSGTTGTPKRVPLKFDNFERAVMDVAFYEAGSESGDITLKRSVAFAPTPLVHIGGIWTILSNMVVGRAVVLFEKFNVEEWHRAVMRHRPKLVSMPPAAIRMVFDAKLPKEDLSSLIALRSGSAPLDPDFADEFEARYGIPILDSYGATEFGGGVAGWTWQDYQQFGKQKRGSVGRANKGCTLRVVHPESNEELARGKVGLLEVKAPQVGDGNWVRTTDLAEIDADGFLYIRGRADDAIIRGGFKILPQTVSKVLLQHPSVGDASVVGIPNTRLGALPVAAVELKKGEPVPSEEELLAFARQQLVAYQVPARILIVDQLPRTNSMKISQPAVKALFKEGAIDAAA